MGKYDRSEKKVYPSIFSTLEERVSGVEALMRDRDWQHQQTEEGARRAGWPEAQRSQADRYF